MNTHNNTRIAHNTILLYIRMVISIIVSLFTVRIILKVLGASDYGIYSVVGGIVTLFTFLSATLASASQRFFAYELGRNNKEKLREIFSMTFNIYVIIIIVIIIAAETGGLWLLNNKMTIPVERIWAARWLYQLSILTFMFTIIRIPYNALLIAYENIFAYTWIGIIEVLLKLLIVILLSQFRSDKLVMYGILLFAVTIIITSIFYFYSSKKYRTAKYKFTWNSELFRALIGYSSWNMLGTLASIGKNQGLNILLNMFFNPIINSAMAIASQINGVINQLINNLYLATRPQITKYYASGQLETMWRLTYTSSKIAFYILMTLSLPLFLEIKYILNIWLSDVPLQTEIFTRFLIVNLLIESSYNQLIAGLQAANKLKKIQLYDSTLLLSLIPLSFWGLKIFPNTMLPMCLMTLLSTLRIATYLYINKIELDLSIKNYIKKVLSKELIVLIIISIPISSLHYILSPGIFRLAYVSIATIILSAITIWSVGLENSEKDLLFNLLKKND